MTRANLIGSKKNCIDKGLSKLQQIVSGVYNALQPVVEVAVSVKAYHKAGGIPS